MTWPHCTPPVLVAPLSAGAGRPVAMLGTPSADSGIVPLGVGIPIPDSGMEPAKLAGGTPGIVGRPTLVSADGIGQPFWIRH
jgi:hypothetical protein